MVEPPIGEQERRRCRVTVQLRAFRVPGAAKNDGGVALAIHRTAHPSSPRLVPPPLATDAGSSPLVLPRRRLHLSPVVLLLPSPLATSTRQLVADVHAAFILFAYASVEDMHVPAADMRSLAEQQRVPPFDLDDRTVRVCMRMRTSMRTSMHI